MVTLPSEAASDEALVRRLVSSGMNMRPHQRRPRRRVGVAGHGPQRAQGSPDIPRPCRSPLTFPVPNSAPGPLEPGPEVLRLRPDATLRGRASGRDSISAAGEPSRTARPTRSSSALRGSDGAARGTSSTSTGARGLHGTRRDGCRGGRLPRRVWDTTYLETGRARWPAKETNLSRVAFHAIPRSIVCGRATSCS